MTDAALATQARLLQIAQARRALLEPADATGGAAASAIDVAAQGWIARSWRRCLQAGRRPDERLEFAPVQGQQLRRVREQHHALQAAARPVIEQLTRAIASTRYFAIVTDAQGVVVDAHGPIDRSDRRATLITRVGVDLSEPAVGTTAIGAALAEGEPVWLHRGEHFFDDTSCYSCAGAPLAGPDGRCIGMLDLTGVDAVERPELRHLAAQAARSIENALVLARPHALVLRLNWPGRLRGDDEDALVCLDAEGWVRAANPLARQLLPGLCAMARAPVHCSELVAEPWEPLFDDARRAQPAPRELALWSGLRLTVLAGGAGAGPRSAPLPLRALEVSVIRQAVAAARGNVTEAARALGISRATVYRKLASRT